MQHVLRNNRWILWTSAAFLAAAAFDWARTPGQDPPRPLATGGQACALLASLDACVCVYVYTPRARCVCALRF